MIKVLQTSALPLGDVARKRMSRPKPAILDEKPKEVMRKSLVFLRAGDEIRTRDLLLGKEMFYR